MNDYKELIAKCDEWIEKVDNIGADNLANHISACADAIEQIVKERDAAVADLKEINLCNWCWNKNKHIIGKDKETQADVDLGECGQGGGLFHQLTLSGRRSWCEKFEWRGVQEDNR